MTEDMQDPSNLERRYVHDVYKEIAPQFSHTKYKAWPKVRQFLWQLPKRSIVADIGCGNGKYFNVTDRLCFIGCDVCPELVELARTKASKCDACLAHNLYLPFRSDSFDAVISIAVIHHFSTEKRRLMAIAEMARILRPGGKIMIYVWALEQSQRQFCAQDVLVPWHLTPQLTQGAKDMSVDSANEDEKDSKRIIKVDVLSTAEKVVGGSIGIEPLSSSSSSPPAQTDKNGSQTSNNNSDSLRGLATNLGRRFEKMFSLSPKKRNENPQQKLLPPPSIPPEFLAASIQKSKNLATGMTTGVRDSMVANVARLSPLLGRKLAQALGTQSPDRLLLDSYADEVSEELVKTAIQVYLATRNNNITPPNPNQISPAKDEGPVFYRYYHVFKQGELEALVSQVPSLKISNAYYDHANWCVVAEKQ